MRMAATAAVYNRLHNTSVGVVGGGLSSGQAGGGSGGGLGHHHQLARSLERILEEAHLSGELILTNRKLKDFPKTGTKYNLNDTVIADLSRNRFCELPEEITTFSFLETLLLYHNTIRSIPESVKHLTSLTYLDLRSNQLSSLPRELCFLPLQVLLVSNNRLTALPDELGRMDRLTDLDASYNQLTTLPARIGELRSLRSFSLRSNQLMYLPRELTCLTLVSLDVSNNRISSLPLEIRQMSTLVEINLENNPMTSPPASLCVRGLVHVFKYLETQATKEEKGSRAGGNYDGYTTLRRAPRNNSNGNVLETHRVVRHHVDSGYSTCDGIDKRWSHDMPLKSKNESPIRMTPTTPPLTKASLLNADLMDASLTSSTSTIVDESISVTAAVVKPLNMESQSMSDLSCSPIKRKDENNLMHLQQQHLNYVHNHSSSSSGSTPDLDDGMIDHNLQQQPNGKLDDKANKNLGNIQTYREYKEALKQQRSQEVYKLKEQKHVYDANETPSPQPNEDMEIRLNGNAQSAPVPKSIMKNSANNSNATLNGVSVSASGVGNNAVVSSSNGGIEETVVIPKKPIQKVIPSRNTELMSSTKHSANDVLSTVTTNGDCIGYVKPNSPMKTLNGGNVVSGGNGLTGLGVGILTNNNKFTTTTMTTTTTSSTTGGGIKSPVGNNSNKIITGKAHRTVTWNHDIPPEKLSFTMRREFDRQREEIELMTQLRSIIETRLKMTLPDDIASALTDGVILCHLANYVRPRSVASIHVPSPGVSKLTMARCRRNVDNFLEACRKIGVDEELICSCADVIPLSATDADGHDNDDLVTLEDFNDNNDQLYRNNNNCTDAETDNHEEQKRQQQRKILPNPSAVLKTVAALIAMDSNPQHQNIKNLQQQHELQMKLQEFQNQHQQVPQHCVEDKKHYFYINKKPDLSKQRHCMLLENNDSLLEEDEEESGDRELQELMKEEQNQLTATCTKEQMMMEFQNSNYDKFDHYDNNLNSDGGGDGDDCYGNGHQTDNCYSSSKNGHNNASSCSNERKQQEKHVGSSSSSTTTLSVGNLYRHCKLKTFQKIKLNLITHHGNSGGGGSNHCSSSSLLSSSMDGNMLQTIVETDNDVISGNTTSSTTGLYQIIDEKYKIKETELSLKVINNQSSNNNNTSSITSAVGASNMKHKLFDLSGMEKSCEKSSTTLSSATSTQPTDAIAAAATINNTVSKRIEFFEHANIPNGGIIKPKSNIYSIYRVNDNMAIEDEKLVKNVVKLKEAGSSKSTAATSFLLRHDSHTLTIILSCVFINLICCAADVLEGKGVVQVAITVGELFRIHGNGANIQNTSKSPTRATRATLTPSPIV
ncbi:hypothetical protein FF38_08317 [Lucilia cuprina]|uniref:Calponin-homology (CH) domain-containing protein n=1 Tax=Lucilia cuprina TaxID=7375 RepID=A0A0L0CP62_LUCCU|nr:hypothetical protein FF38_08317 [Lucilia cuprina]